VEEKLKWIVEVTKEQKSLVIFLLLISIVLNLIINYNKQNTIFAVAET
jgi:hypothetical protein